MHDIHFAGRIVDLLKDQLRKGEKAEHLTVNVALSPFTHVTKNSLLAAFEILAAKEGLSEVILNIDTEEATIRCKGCGAVTKITKPVTVCPECRQADLEIKYPSEFIIRSIEIEKE